METVSSSPRELIDEARELRRSEQHEAAADAANAALGAARQMTPAENGDADGADVDLADVDLANAESAEEGADWVMRSQYAVLICASEVGRWAQAEAAGRALLQADPAHTEAQDAMATVMLGLERWEEALDLLGPMEEREQQTPELRGTVATSDFIQQFHRRDSLYSRIGQAYLGLVKSGNRDCIVPAARAFCAAREINRHSDSTKDGLNELLDIIPALPREQQLAIEDELQTAAREDLAENETSEHVGHFVRLLEGNRLFHEGCELFDAERHQEAVEAMERARDLCPDSARNCGMLALYYDQLERTADADAAFARVLEIEPGEQNATLHFAEQKISNGDSRAGIADMEALIERHPRNAVGLFSLGRALVNDGQTERARQIADDLLELDPEYHQFLLGLLKQHQSEQTKSPDLDAINLLSKEFEQHVQREDRSEETRTITLLEEDRLIEQGQNVLHLYERELGHYPDDAALKLAMGAHLQRMARLYLQSIVGTFIESNTTIPGCVSSCVCARRAAELLHRAWQIQPDANIACDYFFLFGLASFKATAFHWLQTAERMADESGNADALAKINDLRVRTEARGGARHDGALTDQRVFPRRDTPGLQLQFQNATLPANISAANGSAANAYAPASVRPNLPPVAAGGGYLADWSQAPLAVKVAWWLQVISCAGGAFVLLGGGSLIGLRGASLAIIFVATAISAWFVFGFRQQQSLTWKAQIGMAVLSLLSFPVGTIIYGALLYFWFQPEVKRWFNI